MFDLLGRGQEKKKKSGKEIVFKKIKTTHLTFKIACLVTPAFYVKKWVVSQFNMSLVSGCEEQIFRLYFGKRRSILGS